MAEKIHNYEVQVAWIGNEGTGTSSYRAYSRSHVIQVNGKKPIEGSSDPSFLGDSTRWNPEQLLIASLSACFKLWYLGLCAETAIVVVAYEDNAQGTMLEESNGSGQFTSVVLRPKISLASGSDIEKAKALIQTAHEKCFIARSVNFPVSHAPDISISPDS
ncbi:OsmC family protein [Rhodococcus sp. IEGM1300]